MGFKGTNGPGSRVEEGMKKERELGGRYDWGIMTGTVKIVIGVVLIVGALLGIKLGLLLTFTLIFACIGIPMILIALVAGGLGIYLCVSGRNQNVREAIAAGIAQGVAAAEAKRKEEEGKSGEAVKGTATPMGTEPPGDDLNNLRL